jgi:cytochrome c oxidase subunit 3/cytochrome o ubiquinol oxidase subunit 3
MSDGTQNEIAGGRSLESVTAPSQPLATTDPSNRMPGPHGLMVPPPVSPEQVLTAQQWGMIAFLVSEAAFFSTLLMTYLWYLGRDIVGPTPAEALSLPLVIGNTIVLLSSSVTIYLAERSLQSDGSIVRPRARFCWFWGATIVLGVLFLGGTAYEWYDLMVRHHLTISRNLFGTTYYTVVGFHGLHVTAGVVTMLILLGLGLRQEVSASYHKGVELASWYWHFVDGVWIAVFTIVYLIGR